MTSTDAESPAPHAVAEWLAERSARAGHARQRALVVLAGPSAWGRACVGSALAQLHASAVLWVSDSAPEDAWSVAGPQARQLLGQETGHVIFDAYAGFNPDAFGAIAGTLRAGGLFIVLAPALADWPAYPDPEYARITVPPWSTDELTGRFLARLVRRLRACPEANCIEAGQPLPPQPDRRSAETRADEPSAGGPFRTPDQETAVAAIERVAEGRARRPVALTADRGRGKSAALGLAAARLIEKGLRRILVTAPTRHAVAPLFAHAAEQLQHAHHGNGRITCGDAAIAFVPPDDLARHPHDADLVLVDEAAALPGPLLEDLLRAYPRIAFATTLHGYEGSGRGFALRFERVLDRVTPNWRRLSLEQPIRWAAGDPLEAFTFDALLLDAEAVPAPNQTRVAATDATIESIGRDDLVTDEAALRQLFGLLVMAHYRTTPGDLRNLLDGPNCRIWLARHEETVIGACLTADEGSLDEAMAEAVARGERRARGHLLPQTLAFHALRPEAATLSGRRIVRIAVHPAVHGRGLGSTLLGHIRAATQQEGFAYWGAAFGATPALMRFWARAGMRPVRIGVTREASSGQHAAVMVEGLSSSGRELAQRVQARFAAEWPLRLPEFFTDLTPELVQSVIRTAGDAAPAQPLEEDEQAALAAFVRGQQPYENVAVAVWKAALAMLSHAGSNAEHDPRTTAALVVKVLQKRSWSEAASAGGFTGQRQLREALREALAEHQSASRVSGE
jgi:tRNA(Met) cytidine acetyltransferase